MAATGSTNHSRNLPGICLEELFHTGQIVCRRRSGVSRVQPSGTPALPGIPAVISPEPASTRRQSLWPVIAAGEFDEFCLFPGEAPWAARIALMTALCTRKLTIRIISTWGICSQINSAISTSISVGAPEAQAILAGPNHLLQDFLAVMSQDHGAPGTNVVDVFVAFHIKDVGGLLAPWIKPGASCPHSGKPAPGSSRRPVCIFLPVSSVLLIFPLPFLLSGPQPIRPLVHKISPALPHSRSDKSALPARKTEAAHLADNAVLIDPALHGRGLYHGVFSADAVGRHRHIHHVMDFLSPYPGRTWPASP